MTKRDREAGSVSDAGPASLVARLDTRTDDPERANQELRDTYTDFTTRSSGSTDGFRFTHTGFVAPRVAVWRLRYGMTVEMDVAAVPSSLILVSRTAGGLSVTDGRETARPEVGEPLLMPVGVGWRTVLEDPLVQTVTIDRAVVDRAAESAYGITPDRLRFSSMRPVSASAARYWRDVVEHVRRDVLARAEVSANPLVLAEATRTMAAALLLTFPNSGLALAAEYPPGESVVPAVLRRALAFIDEHAAEDVGIGDVAAAARCGTRALQYTFRRHRGRTPLEELRRVRLARAHADLCAADPSRGDTVAAVAARWGFAHAGRFSVLYRHAYGRSPKETLRR